MLIKYNEFKSKLWRQIVMKKVVVVGGGYGWQSYYRNSR